jgi:hypothetical protein
VLWVAVKGVAQKAAMEEVQKAVMEGVQRAAREEDLRAAVVLRAVRGPSLVVGPLAWVALLTEALREVLRTPPQREVDRLEATWAVRLWVAQPPRVWRFLGLLSVLLP